MPILRPFIGLVYNEGVAGPMDSLTAPPYDAITAIDQDRYYGSSPSNVIRLILGKEAEGDDGTNNKYTRAASHLRSWRDQGILVTTREPCFYPYELDFRFGGRLRRVRGVIAEVELEPWGGSIIPHERTFPGPMEDRLSLLRAVRANLSPIYGLIAGPSEELTRFLDRAMASPADREVTDEQGTRHRLWAKAGEGEKLGQSLREERLLIADGHHRYSVALAFRDEMRKRVGAGPWDSMMVLIVDGATEDPPVLPIHRIVRADDTVPEPPGDRVRDMAEVLTSLRDDDLTYGTVRLDRGEVIHAVARVSGSPPTVCALHERVLDRMTRADIRYVPDSVQAERAVMTGEASAAYLLPPTRVQRVWEVVGRNGRLPQKSTYFWPKPRTGMIIRPFAH